jgi:beta-galactosidase
MEWPAVGYVPGVLSAVAYRGGQKVATQELRTFGAPARLQIRPLASPLTGDLSLYEITILDTTGLLVTDATSPVTVHVEGAGQLIGLDTGDLMYGGLFKVDTRNAHQGRLLVTVRSTAPAGEIRLNATAPNLANATYTSPLAANGQAAP